MNGQLFPLDASERVDDARRIAGLPIPNSTSHRRKTSVRTELLDSLLQVVEWQEGERRKAKGKEVVRDQPTLKSPVTAPMSSVPSSLSVTSLSSSASPSRSGSWLTFGSWRSTATDITTPDSPTSSPVSSQPCLPTVIETQREFHPRSAFVRISVEESPLCSPITSQHGAPLEDDAPCATPPGSASENFPSLTIRGTLVKRVSRSVTTIVEVAKGLQSAYLTATMFAAGSYLDSATPPQPRGHLRCQWQARREGYRALAIDVQKFTDCPPSISQISEPVHFIPLVSQPSGSAGLPKPPVPKNTVIIPSPLRPRTPPAALAYRMRPVANPAVLRLRALQNLMCARGKEWEGRARDGGLGCGKERMVGIAFEGRGRSGLGCEVRFVVA